MPVGSTIIVPGIMLVFIVVFWLKAYRHAPVSWRRVGFALVFGGVMIVLTVASGMIAERATRTAGSSMWLFGGSPQRPRLDPALAPFATWPVTGIAERDGRAFHAHSWLHTEDPRSGSFFLGAADITITDIQYGAPFRSLRRLDVRGPASTNVQLPLLSSGVPLGGGYIAPLRPILPQLCVNWLIFALAGHVLGQSILWLRAIRRARRGACLTCGYDIASVRGPCPECGSGAIEPARPGNVCDLAVREV